MNGTVVTPTSPPVAAIAAICSSLIARRCAHGDAEVWLVTDRHAAGGAGVERRLHAGVRDVDEHAEPVEARDDLAAESAQALVLDGVDQPISLRPL